MCHEYTPIQSLDKENMLPAIMSVSEKMKNEERKMLVSLFVDEIFKGLAP